MISKALDCFGLQSTKSTFLHAKRIPKRVGEFQKFRLIFWVLGFRV